MKKYLIYPTALLLFSFFTAQAETDIKPTPAEMLIERFDESGDGTLNAGELQEAMAFLRQQRREAMRENRPERAVRERARDRQREGESVGKESSKRQEWRDRRSEERREPRSSQSPNKRPGNMASIMIERFDENKDGQLNEMELANLIEWMQENRRGQNRPNR